VDGLALGFLPVRVLIRRLKLVTSIFFSLLWKSHTSKGHLTKE
jgi:hypothetical protein